MFNSITDTNYKGDDVVDIRYSQTLEKGVYTATRTASKAFSFLGIDADAAPKLAEMLKARFTQSYPANWVKSGNLWTRHYFTTRTTDVTVSRKSYQSCEISVNVSEVDTIKSSSRITNMDRAFIIANDTRTYFDSASPGREYCPYELTGDLRQPDTEHYDLQLVNYDPDRIAESANGIFLEFMVADSYDGDWTSVEINNVNASIVTVNGVKYVRCPSALWPSSSVNKFYRIRLGQITPLIRRSGAKMFMRNS